MAVVHTIPYYDVVRIASQLVMPTCNSNICNLVGWAQMRVFYSDNAGYFHGLVKCNQQCPIRIFGSRLIGYINARGAIARRGDIVRLEADTHDRHFGQYNIIARRYKSSGRHVLVLGYLSEKYWEYGHQRSTFLAPTQFSPMHFSEFSQWVFMDPSLDWKYASADIVSTQDLAIIERARTDPKDFSAIDSLALVCRLQTVYRGVQYTILVCSCGDSQTQYNIDILRNIWSQLECRCGTDTVVVAILP